MPKATKITKCMILDTSFDLVRNNGIEGLSNREIAKTLGCSIRPIYYQFASSNDLHIELRKKIENYFIGYLSQGTRNSKDYVFQIFTNYISFARNEKNLFKFLFMSGLEFSFDIFGDFFKVTDKKLKESYITMLVLVHGIAVMTANGTCAFSDKEISQMLSCQAELLGLNK